MTENVDDKATERRPSVPKTEENHEEPSHPVQPLHDLIESSKEDIDDLLVVMVTQGLADINLTSQEGMTPLHAALRLRQPPDVECIVAKLVSLGADINVRDERLRRPSDYAISLNLWSLVPILTDEEENAEEAYKEFVKERQDFYGAKLVTAVIKGTEEEIKECLAKKANVNYINKLGAGAIHYVITHCKLSKFTILGLLLDNKADVNLKDVEKDTALNLTVKLVDQFGKPHAIELIKMLLDAGAKTSIVDLDGKDARHIAIENRHHDIAEMLGVPPLQKAPTPAPSSVKSPTPSIVTSPSPIITAKEIEVQTDLPVEENEDEDTKQKEFYQAVKDANQTLTAELAVDEEVNINVADKEGFYAIHYCLQLEDAVTRLEVLNVLLENDVNVDVQETQMWKTPLHFAAELDDLNTVKLLLLHNANVRLKNKEKEMPYDTAIRLGNQEIADILEKYRKEQLKEKMKRGAKKASNCLLS